MFQIEIHNVPLRKIRLTFSVSDRNCLKSNPTKVCEEIADLVATHMGQWNTDYRNGLEIMQKPSTKAQSFVHLCDYLASRKFLEFNFGVYSAS